MTRGEKQNGYILMPVVLAITLIATIAFMINYDSSLETRSIAGELEPAQAQHIAQAGLAHAIWQTQNSGCAGDMAMTTVPFGPGDYTTTVDSAATVTVYSPFLPDRDTWIDGTNTTANHSGNTTLRVKNDAGGGFRGLTHFDLSSITAGSRVATATLWFYLTDNDPDGVISIHPVTAAWTETDATWDSIGDSYDSQVFGTITPQPAAGAWVSVNLTALTQSWVNDASTNHGLMLIAVSDKELSQYTSKEYGTANLRPYLQVTTAVGDVSPLNITVTGTLTGNPSPANDVTRTLTRVNVPAYQPGSYTTLQPGAASGKDAEIYDQAPNNNYGNGAETWVSSVSNDTTRTLLRFNMDAIPAGARILGATLSLDRQSGSGADQPVSAHRIRNPWSEDSVTWNSRETGTNWDTAGGDFDSMAVATTPVGPVNQRYEWSITPLAQGWVDGSYPNYGVALVAAIAGMAGERFYTSDHADPTRHPRLTITYACECGSACLAPQGSGKVLMVVSNAGTPDPEDVYKQALMEAWGYTVKMISDGAGQGGFDSDLTLHDVVYISETIDSATLGTKLGNPPIGIVNEDGWMNDELGIESGNSSNWPVGDSISITDTSHYITAPFASGSLPIYAADMSGLAIGNTPAPDLQSLADWGSDAGLAVLDTGAMTAGGGPTAGRRIMLPFGRDVNMDWPHVNSNGLLILQRALQWGTGNTGGAPVLIYRDEFTNRNCNAADYTGSNGELDWSPWAWVETFDDGTSCGGKFGLAEDPVVIEPGNYRLEVSGNLISIARQVDLSAFTQAYLSFDYRADSMSNNVHVIFEAWDDAGGTWVEVGRISGPLNETAYTSTGYNISPYISANAEIRISTSGLGNLEFLYIDNLQISETPVTPSSAPLNLLLVVGDATTLVSKDAGRKTLMESWGHTVTVIDDGDSQANFDAAAAAADVVYVSGTVVGGSLLDKLTGSATAIVNEFPGKLDNFGFSSGTTSTVNDRRVDTTDPAHYITEPFSGGSVFLLGTSIQLPVPSGTLAPDLQVAGSLLGTPMLVTLEAGATRWDGNPAPARRAFLPFAPAESTDLTTDGKTIIKRSLEWAAGVGGAASTAPIAHWKLDETSGTTAVDSVGGHDGALTGSSWSTGKVDGGLIIDGSTEKVQIPHDVTLSLTNAFTLTAWINTDAISPGYETVIGKTNGIVDNYWFGIVSDEVVLEFLITGTRYTFSTTGANLLADTWYHISASFDDVNDSVRLYIDGVETLSDTFLQTPVANTADVIIGNSVYLNENWNGVLDDIRIYDSALSASEIASLYTAGTGGGGGGGGCDGTYRDEFITISYSNSDGTLTWATDWLEINESDGPSLGDEQVKTGVLLVNDNDGGGEGAQREADLTGAASATLSFDYKRKSLDNASDYVTIDISANGDAGPWVELDRFEGPGSDTGYLPVSYDIGAYISSNTRIRFLTSPDLGDRDELNFDNVQIECTP